MDSVDQDIINALISASSSEILCSWSEIEQELPPAASTRQFRKRRREVQGRPSSSSSDEGLNRTQYPMRQRRSKQRTHSNLDISTTRFLFLNNWQAPLHYTGIQRL